MNFQISILAILTAHNRRQSTLDCLVGLWTSAQEASIRLEAILVDDGSTDDTVEAVRARFPWVEVDLADGSLYWTRGMQRAEALALTKPDWDYLLWINDDTYVFPDALKVLLQSVTVCRERHDITPIMVGSTQDPVTLRRTYGGANGRTWLVRFGAYHVGGGEDIEECNVFTGNLVLIHRSIVRGMGGIDPVFEHAMGDTDYARRAIGMGYRCFVAPGYLAHCMDNPNTGSYRDTSLSLSQRWQLILDRKGLPPKSWLVMLWRHQGWTWPLLFAHPYLKVLTSSFMAVLRGRK